MAEDVWTKFSKRFEVDADAAPSAIAVPLPQADRLRLIRGSRRRRQAKAKKAAREAAVKAKLEERESDLRQLAEAING